MLKFITTIIILTITLPSSFNIFGDPTSTMIKAAPNYNKTKKAVLFQGDGNATVDLAFQISILDYNYKLLGNEIGNTFIVDRNHGAAGLNSTSINFLWLSDDTLSVDHDRLLRTFMQEKKVDGVTIIYKAR